MTEDSLEQVQREIDALKAEALSERDRLLEPTRGPSVQPPVRQSPSRSESVFACNPSEEIYANLLDCICKDEDVHPQAICPQHGEVFD